MRYVTYLIFDPCSIQVIITPLSKEDTIVEYGEAGNYSVTGFEMKLTRNVAK